MSKQPHFFPEDEWRIVEPSYQPALHPLLETLFAVGNGYLGLRGTPEEGFGGEPSGAGTHLPSIWENGTIGYEWLRKNFPTRSQHVPGGPAVTGIGVELDGVSFDPQAGTLLAYTRELDLRSGVVSRLLVWEDAQGRQTEIRNERFASKDQPQLVVLRCTVRPLNYGGAVTFEASLDGRVAQSFAVERAEGRGDDGAVLVMRTRVVGHELMLVMRTRVSVPVAATALLQGDAYLARRVTVQLEPQQACVFEKYIGVASPRDLAEGDALARAAAVADAAAAQGVDALHAAHVQAWEAFWQAHDVRIEGDRAGQQGIRFCLFNLEWNYRGNDPRINVGAKGICDRGYGGLYFWDSETYLVPCYAYVAPEKARNILLQRYQILDKARAKAAAFGYQGAMYPFVTLDGEECGVPWELPMLEQHINAAIPFAVRTYVEATDDREFLRDFGAEIVLEQARFWASRVARHPRKGYVLNAVTGPDEYAMVVNNNCYTNRMCRFTMEYALSVARWLRTAHPDAWEALRERLALAPRELTAWRDIARHMYIPFDAERGIHPQDDAFLDMDPVDVRAIPHSERPLLRGWTWERLIRTQVLKQPDVLLLMYLLHDQFDPAEKLANYRYYEPKTIHDSSLSPCIHSILAAELELARPAFAYYGMTARLDLDDVNGNANQGIHIANHAGSWMCIVNGFAGMRVSDGALSFTPHLPAAWKRLAFQLSFQGRTLHLDLRPQTLTLTLHGTPLTITVNAQRVRLQDGKATRVALA